MICRDDAIFLINMMNVTLFPPPEISVDRITQEEEIRDTQEDDLRITEGI